MKHQKQLFTLFITLLALVSLPPTNVFAGFGSLEAFADYFARRPEDKERFIRINCVEKTPYGVPASQREAFCAMYAGTKAPAPTIKKVVATPTPSPTIVPSPTPAPPQPTKINTPATASLTTNLWIVIRNFFANLFK